MFRLWSYFAVLGDLWVFLQDLAGKGVLYFFFFLRIWITCNKVGKQFGADSLTWSRSGAAGREDDSIGVGKPPPGRRRRPEKWWPEPRWPQSPPSP